MSTHDTPRWANLIFGLSAPVILGTVVIRGYLLGYDFAQIVGFLWWNFGLMFMAWLAIGLVLYGVVMAVNVLRGRQRILTPATAQIARSNIVGILGFVAGAAVAWAIVLWHPFGHLWSIGAAFVIALGSYALMIWRLIITQRAYGKEAMQKAQDEILKWNDDEDHKWYGI